MPRSPYFVALGGLAALALLLGSPSQAQFDESELPLRMARPATLPSSAMKLATQSAPPETIYVGYTPGRFNPTNNWWSIGSGQGPGFRRPPAQGGMWDFEPTGGTYLHGDSLQGWWPRRLIYSTTGGQTLADWRRPWWAVDIGNQINYTLGPGKRTFGIVGAWHRDDAGPPSNGGVGQPAWTPLGGSYSAWMGLRRSGDLRFIDSVTGNPFDDNCAQFNVHSSIASTGTDKGFPGYGSQWDQMLYRDIDMGADPGASLTITFRYRTNMSTSVANAPSTRTGWFDKDPLQVTDNGGLANAAPGNFISSTVAGDANAPRDSFMVYVGAPVVDSACVYSNGTTARVFDPMRRWFSEVVRATEPGLHREIHGNAGDASPALKSVTIPSSLLAPMLAASGNRVRLVFRVKTNRAFDDEGTNYTSGGAGAAVIDDVTYAFGVQSSPPGWGDFEAASGIDNAVSTSPLTAWKSTGKPPSNLAHAHALSSLTYEDLCGDAGSNSRICNMAGVVMSIGDHDNSEAAGGLVPGTADRERNDGIASPAIQLCGPYPNPIGLASLDDATPTHDFLLSYELYTGVFDVFTQGNVWQPGIQSYPAAGKSGYPTWGNVRYTPFMVFNPEVKCFGSSGEGGVIGNGMLRWASTLSQSPQIPDSVRMLWLKRQECFRFGISTGCSPTDGCYLDNFSLAIVDGVAPDLQSSIWDFFQDTFPANETAGLPGNAAAFDTTSAYTKSGVNIAPTTGNMQRYNVPGDSAAVYGFGNQVRVDLVFRILPGPGNYATIGRPDLGTLRRVPTDATPIGGPVPNSSSFWENYLANNGAKGTPGGHSGGVWSPNVWNSARCDTAESGVFAFQGRGVLGGPPEPALFRTTYHESELGIAPNPALSDPYPVLSHRAALGIPRHRCYVASPTAPPQTAIDCVHNAPGVGPGYDLSYVALAGSGWDGSNTTIEGTKILPDGQLTPGAHVQYFFRKEASGVFAGLLPDTNLVVPQVDEGSTDAHRWQQFGVLPDRWKDVAYRHPVTGMFGAGAACMLVVDGADRRGDETAWVSIADSIGLTRPDRFGAHNGWHARGDQSVNDPAAFVSAHLGQAGTSWDLYQVKAAESLNSSAGSIGSRLSFRNPANTQINDKSSRLGPTPEMLEAYYRSIVYLSGDLNSGVMGPYINKSANDVQILTGWLLDGNVSVPDRYFWAIGNGFIESNHYDQVPQTGFNEQMLGVTLRNASYLNASGNGERTPDLLPAGSLAVFGDVWGVRSLCSYTNNVLDRSLALFDETVVLVEYEPQGPGPFPLANTILKQHTPAHPWIAATTGIDIEHLVSRFGDDTRGRNRFVQEMLTGPLGAVALCPAAGFPPLDVPTSDGVLAEYVRLANNPLRSGPARIEFALATADHVTVRIHDVAGRLVRTLARREFPAGEHVLRWDGADDGGTRLARGVYFARMERAASGREVTSKIVVLR